MFISLLSTDDMSTRRSYVCLAESEASLMNTVELCAMRAILNEKIKGPKKAHLHIAVCIYI